MVRCETVLLIGQNIQGATCLRGHLEESGFEVLTVTNGPMALDLLSSQVVALVLIDFVPPTRHVDDADHAQMDSFQLLRRLRLESDVGVIILSRESDEAIRLYFLDSGADDYVMWPYRCRELVLRMRAVMRRAGHRTAH
jgi:DNA-binding response OmpR family regulator